MLPTHTSTTDVTIKESTILKKTSLNHYPGNYFWMNYGCVFVWFIDDICRCDDVSPTSLRTFRLLSYD